MDISKLHLALGITVFLAGTSPADAQLTWSDVLFFEAPADLPSYANQRLAKAAPDECYAGIGVDYPPLNPDGSCDVGEPKANHAYVWGLTQAGVGNGAFTGPDLWFGTIANPLCGGAAGFFEPEPYENLSWVCEYGQSQLSRNTPLPPSSGDWRLPRAYSYDLETGQLVDRTPTDSTYRMLGGLRSGGSLGDAVFLAGPTLRHQVVFAFWDAATSTYHGACRATRLSNIRNWIVVNDTLYAAVGGIAGDGAILRWTGTVADPFNGAGVVSDYCGFEVVATLPGFPAYVASYNDQRLAVSVWNPNRRLGDAAVEPALYPAGVYVGPPFGPDGMLTPADTGPWIRIWSPFDYETDPVVATTTGGGAIAFWQGYLWFGSMQSTQGTLQTHTSCTLPTCFGPPANQQEQIDVLFNVHRAVSIWRARLVQGGRPEVELLYGESQLPALVPGTKSFELRPTGHIASLGRSGFDNPFLTYTWSAVAADQLFFGLYDYRYVFDIRLGLVTETSPPAAHGGLDESRGYGGDLWRFDALTSHAQPERVHGMGSFTNYGFRTLLRRDGGNDVLVGTASGLNLEPDAGWELHSLTVEEP